ncbi:MAG: hypothetical protein U0946_01630 [Patescibacteria group bacterium]|nr:hypothetical protein [Patescibacteria group bacterium]
MKLFKLNSKLQLTILIVLLIIISTLILIKPLAPSPTSPPVPIDNPSLQVIDSSPAQNQPHNPFQPIKIYFNLSLNPNSLPISFEPKIDFQLQFDSFNKILTIIPQPKFLPETDYILTLGLSTPFTLRFTTQIEAENIAQWNEESAKQEAEYLKKHGDQDQALMKLRRSAPIYQSTFTIEYNYKNNTYSIKITPPYEQTKTQVIDWLKLQGITDLTNLRLNWIES